MTYFPQTGKQVRLLRYAARLWGIKVSYDDNHQQLVHAKSGVLIKLLEQLSKSEIKSEKTLQDICYRRKDEHYKKIIEPVVIFWHEQSQNISLLIAVEKSNPTIRIHIKTERGKSIARVLRFSDLRIYGERRHKGRRYLRAGFHFSVKIPLGYHHLQVKIGKQSATSLLICAPPNLSKLPFMKNMSGAFGGFAPLYSLRSRGDMGIGGFRELESLQQWLKRFNVSWFGSTPLLALNFDAKSPDISPYSPVSRLFWNEIYLDIEKLVEQGRSARALALFKSPGFNHERARLNALDIVDYRAVYQLQKKVLMLLADDFFNNGLNQQKSYQKFLKQNSNALAYAKSRSQKKSEQRFHLFAQFQLFETLESNAKQTRKGKFPGLYLDFPVGVSRKGFDCHHYADHFLPNVSAGAPPDDLFEGGQNWGFFPYHPHRIRTEGYAYFIQCLRNHCRFTSLLRIDHVMGFHRIFVIPDGFDAKDGAYIRFRADEFYAITLLEAARHQTAIVGEDLGTVPLAIRQTMQTHDFKRLWVYQFENNGSPAKDLRNIPKKSLASLNTHDTVPFKGFWQGKDLEIWTDHGFMNKRAKIKQQQSRRRIHVNWTRFFALSNSRDADLRFLQKLLIALGKSKADLVQINLEDLWLEDLPQNMPGTSTEYANWQRKMRFFLEDWTRDKNIQTLMKKIAQSRKASAKIRGAS